MNNRTPNLEMAVVADHDEHAKSVEKPSDQPLGLSEPPRRRYSGHSCPKEQLTGVFRRKTAARRARGSSSRSYSGSGDDAVAVGGDSGDDGEERGRLASVGGDESPWGEGTWGEAPPGEFGPGVEKHGVHVQKEPEQDKTGHQRPDLLAGLVTNTPQTLQGDATLQKDTSSRHMGYPRPRPGAIGTAPRAWGKGVTLQEADELGFDAQDEIRRKSRGGADYEPKTSPMALVDSLDYLARLHDPAEQAEVLLLVSTLDSEQGNQHAHLIRHGGLDPQPGRWAFLQISQPVGGAGYSLVTRTSSQAAREVLEAFHWSHFTGPGTGETKPLRVMYVEPRGGGELLVEGLTMPEGEHTMMRMLVYYFNAYEIAAISDAQPMTGQGDSLDRYWCTVEFARRGQAEEAVSLNGGKFFGRPLEITLVRDSNG